ncbi:MAG: DUF3750 domain-containing protein [Cyclobacteriaceae bacterium]
MSGVTFVINEDLKSYERPQRRIDKSGNLCLSSVILMLTVINYILWINVTLCGEARYNALMDRVHHPKRNWFSIFLKGFGLLIVLGIFSAFVGKLWRDNRPAIHPVSLPKYPQWSGKSYGFAPHPDEESEAVIQIYAARTRGTKQVVAVHSWIATKSEGASKYTTSEIFGWRLRRNGTALRQGNDVPDHDWYGHPPDLLLDIRGPQAVELIPKIDNAIANYPYQQEYTAWPGPNSNTFIAWIGKEVPELGLDLPSTAIGKDWRPFSEMVGPSPSGTGLQASFWGLLGLSVGWEEGLELNLFGLSFELDLLDLAIELPGIGRIGTDPVGCTPSQ